MGKVHGSRRSKPTRRRTLRVKKKKTRKQKGGADYKRIQKNIIAASKLGASDDSNLYYSIKEEDMTKGHALVIAPRYSGVTGVELKAAKYPYEECLFFFDVDLGGVPPNNYPNAPPHLKHQTPAIYRNYRLHPNLYEHHSSSTPQYSGKVCLGILGTWGNNDWNSTMSISEVLQGIMGILEANPGTYEPGCITLTDKRPNGILYNTHTMYESIETTCKAYEKVFKAVTLDGNSVPKFENANVAREGIPPFMKPFLDILAKRGFSALTFLSGKIDNFISANGGKSKFHLIRDMHHAEKIADFASLKACLEGVKALIPKALQKNIFKFGVGETHRALFELSKPLHPSGRPMTYEEFVQEIQEREMLKVEAEKEKKKAELGVNSCPSESNNSPQEASTNENTTAYVYNNFENDYEYEYEEGGEEQGEEGENGN